MNKIDLGDLGLGEMEEVFFKMGVEKYRAGQVYGWINRKLVNDFAQMTNLSLGLRKALQENFKLSNMEVLEKNVSNMDNTIKYLFKLEDKNIIESVLMKYKYGNSVCISTQVGCRMGCKFCASSFHGMVRNLTAREILLQVYEMQRDMSGERISNIVLMGQGEPLDNLANVVKFIGIINSKEGLNISNRNVTLSTCGLIDKINELKEKNIKITLAVSLHAPTDEIRLKIMPIAKKNPLDELLLCCFKYANHTKRRVTFEYAMIKGLNDSIIHAHALSKKLSGTLSHVNLIPINEIEEASYEKSSKKAIEGFHRVLESNGIEATIRRKLGSDINASCGQLRNRVLNK